MLTPEHLLQAFSVLEDCGVRRPDDLADPDPERSLRRLQERARAYHAVLAEETPEDVASATIAWVRQASPFWPSAGQLLALIPGRRQAALDDAAPAWATVKAWCHRKGRNPEGCGYREPKAGELDPENPARDNAMREALRCAGGVRGFMLAPEGDEPWIAKRFCDAYRVHRERRAFTQMDQEVARFLGPPGHPRASGFQHVLGGSAQTGTPPKLRESS